MPTCRNCRNRISYGFAFCPYCGNRNPDFAAAAKRSQADLRQILMSRNNTLGVVLEKSRKKIEPLLAKICETFPDYTVHDIRHSDSVVEILGWLIPKSLLESIDDYELFFILEAAYLHDVGMANFPELLQNNNEYEDYHSKKEKLGYSEDQIIQEYIREYHHLRSEEYTTKHYLELFLEDEFQSMIVGRICRGHRDDLGNRDLYKNKEMYTNKGICVNLCLLSAILKLADDLDLTFQRSPIEIYRSMYPSDQISCSHWEKHLSVAGVGLDPENPTQIVVTAKCKDHKIHRSLKKQEIRIQGMLNELPNYLYQYRSTINDIPQRIDFEIDAIGYKPLDIKFILDEKSITELLMGERIYENKDIFVRELLQNAIDSCRLRSVFEKDYQPSIQVDQQGHEITVSDNGLGMDLDKIERYLARVGSSFYRSPEFLETGADFTPISRFGIGLLSCFMVADKIVIQTKCRNSEPIEVEMNNISEYFYITQGNRQEIGTSVTVKLKTEEANMDLERAVLHHIRHVELPIKLKISSGKTSLVREGTQTAPVLRELAKKGYRTYPKKVDTPTIKGVIAIVGIKGEKEKMVFTRNPMDAFISVVMISNEGIYIGNFPDLIQGVNGIMIDVNVKGMDLDLDLSRTRILPGKKRDKLARILRGLCIELLREHFHLLERREGRKEVYKESQSLFEGYIDKSPSSNETERETWLDYFRELLYHPTFSEGIVDYMTLNEILSSSKQKYLVTKSMFAFRANYMTRLEYFSDIFTSSTWLKPDAIYIFEPPYAFFEILSKESIRFQTLNLLRSLESHAIRDCPRYFPKTWKVVEYTQYKTSRLLDDFGFYQVYVNAGHPFIEILLKYGKDVIRTEERKKRVASFFGNLRRAVPDDFAGILREQKTILDWFGKAEFVTDTKGLLLTHKSFPPTWTA